MTKSSKMRTRRTLAGILLALVVVGGCTRDAGDRVVMDRRSAPKEAEPAASAGTTVPAVEAEPLESAIAAGDDIVPVVRAPRAARASGPRVPRAAPAARPAKGPTGKSIGASGGNGPWTPGPDAPKSFAVVIGIQNYQGRTKDTYGGLGDANAFMEALRRSGWARENVLFLTEGAATGAAIRNAMQWLVDRSGPDTFTVFHYSGHVKQQGVGNEFLWSVDNQFIRNTEFGSVMSRLRGRAWVDVAGCEAAGFDKGISSPSRLFTGASQVTEKGYENPDWRQSIWTGLSVDQGILQGQADENRNGTVTIQEAARFGANRAPGMTQGQQYGPQHPYIAGGSGEWALGRPAPPPPPSPPPSGGGGGGGGGGGSPPTSQPPGCAGLVLGIKC